MRQGREFIVRGLECNKRLRMNAARRCSALSSFRLVGTMIVEVAPLPVYISLLFDRFWHTLNGPLRLDHANERRR